MEQSIIDYIHSSESEENQPSTPSLGNDMGLLVDNNAHLLLRSPLVSLFVLFWAG